MFRITVDSKQISSGILKISLRQTKHERVTLSVGHRHCFTTENINLKQTSVLKKNTIIFQYSYQGKT